MRLKPHLVKKAHYSNDPDFEKKLKEVVGLVELYLAPPDNVIILCIDEKTQIQALERTQHLLPIIRTVPERQTVDYERHRTATLFAALDVLSGNVIGEYKERHTSKDYIPFLKKVDRNCPEGKALPTFP
jgi:cell division protein FtsX